ncbi:hypothetical protein GCM10010495_36710 [Kitasatospora herbaricolor]|nr:hypothetical protein GCM10010495_36710 [Kitasatospora herbaricolor]
MLPYDARPPDGPPDPTRPAGGAGTGRAGFGLAGSGPTAGRRPLAGAEDTVHLSSAQDTLQVIANADRWAQLTYALDDALVPLAVGDVDALRHLAKLEQPVLDALTRWIGTANRGRLPSGPTGGLPG